MPIVFFEGFNNSDSDAVKLDANYWSTNNQSALSFVGGRTNNMLRIANRPVASGIASNNTVTLSNINPLSGYNAVGLGFYLNGRSIVSGPTNQSYSVSPHNEPFLSFMNGSTEVLRVDVISSTFNGSSSMAFAIYQSNTLVSTYDLKSVVGSSWNIDPYTFGVTVREASYFEIYTDPKNANQVAIRFSANNTKNAYLTNNSNNIYTTINGFSNVSSIVFYGISEGVNSQTGSSTKMIDDLYLTAGNNISSCLLGENTRIYKLNPNEDGTTQFQTRVGGVTNPGFTPQFTTINNNDGDGSYIFAATSGIQGLFGLENMSNSSPSGIGGIKITNVAKKTSVDENKSFTNIMSSGAGQPSQEVGSVYTVNSTNYTSYSSFLFNNPQTGSGWLQSEINNAQIGVKIV
jgi:hypothetical protein